MAGRRLSLKSRGTPVSFQPGGPTPISPPLVKSADLLRPVVDPRGRATATIDVRRSAFSFNAVLRFQPWRRSLTRHPTPIEAQPPRDAEGERRNARGLETQSCPRTGLLMTGDVTTVRPLSPGSGEGPHQSGTRNRRGREKVGVPSTARAAGPLVPDRAWRWSARCRAIVSELGP
jgi:hypothetical protein